MRTVSLWLLVAALVMLAVSPAAARPAAAPIVISQCDDSGLNAALAAASPGDTITFNCGAAVTIPVLSTKNIAISLTIDGANGGKALTLSGAAARQVFTIAAGTAVTLSNMTIRDGSGGAAKGGGINNAGALALKNVALRNNTATEGAGIYNAGALTITDGQIVSNNGQGIYSASGTLIVQNTQVMSNTVAGLEIGSGTVNVSNSTVAGNNNSGMRVSGGTVSVSGSQFTNNTGNALINFSGSVTISGSSFSGSGNIFANCAAVCNAYGNAGTLSIDRSTFTNNTNTANSFGASALFNGNVARVTNSVFYNNKTSGSTTGTIVSSNYSMTIVNSTVAANANTAITNTAAVLQSGTTGTLQLGNSTIYGNTGAGVRQVSGTVIITNSIVSGNTTSNCAGTITNGGHNLSAGGCAGFAAGDPALGTLGNNGGPTLTLMPQPGSPALDAVAAALCPPTDQRGVARPMPGGGLCDIGAVERQPTVYLPVLVRHGP